MAITSLAGKKIGSPDDAYTWYLQSGGVALAGGITVGLGDGTETKLFLDADGVGFRNAGGFTTSFRCSDGTADQTLDFHYTASTGKVFPELVAVLASDATNSTVTPAAVGSFSVTLAASGLYEFEMLLVVESVAITTSPRLSIEGPSGETTWVFYEILTGLSLTTIATPASSGMQSMSAWGTHFDNTTNAPAINTPYSIRVRGMCQMSGTTPSAPVSLEVWSEIAASQITLKAGSMMRFRKLN